MWLVSPNLPDSQLSLSIQLLILCQWRTICVLQLHWQSKNESVLWSSKSLSGMQVLQQGESLPISCMSALKFLHCSVLLIRVFSWNSPSSHATLSSQMAEKGCTSWKHWSIVGKSKRAKEATKSPHVTCDLTRLLCSSSNFVRNLIEFSLINQKTSLENLLSNLYCLANWVFVTKLPD